MTPDAELDVLASHALVAGFLRTHAVRTPRESAVETQVRQAAILLVIREGHEGPELLLIKRAEVRGDPWSGQIACPGGRREPHDADLRATAVRETLEETGIDVARDGRVVGQLDDLRPYIMSLPPIMIRPFVAIVRRDVVVMPSPEVAVAFWVPLAALGDASAWGVREVRAGNADRRVSAFVHGEHTVWGLTERALRQFLEYVGTPPAVEPLDEELSR